MPTLSDIKTFFFLNDGTCAGSDQGLGQKEVSLNDKDRQEAEKAGKILVGYEIASLCFSPLVRTQQIAQIIAKHCHCGLYPIDDFKKDQLKVADEKLLPDAEGRKEFGNRVMSGLNSLLDYPLPILIISHAEVLKIICTDLEVDYPDISSEKGIIHFFQRLGRWVAKPLEISSGN